MNNADLIDDYDPQEVLENLPMAMALLSPEGIVQFANPLYASCFNLTAAEMLEKNIGQFSNYAYQKFMSELAAFEEKGQVSSFELNMGKHYFLVNLKPYLNQQNKIKNVLVCCAEITHLKRAECSLKQHNAELKVLSEKDHLTGLWNRRKFDRNLEDYEQMLSNMQLDGFSMIMLDFDNFKQINDRFGHSFGDDVLQTGAQALEYLLSGIQGADLYRIGGEEFAVLLPNMQLQRCCELAQLCCAAVAELSNKYQEQGLTLTVSCGAASSLSGQNRPFSILQCADQALYKAKLNQKNCTYYYENNEIHLFTHSQIN
ncbi:sensor domain-containing diguanylate cyclase [Acinetobacter rudis]|uniref:sensor domain-containing diguanylate cyclase n=1 Tax=Acinetobacter rudis TaxID=632955 RepID=UPI003340645A